MQIEGYGLFKEKRMDDGGERLCEHFKQNKTLFLNEMNRVRKEGSVKQVSLTHKDWRIKTEKNEARETWKQYSESLLNANEEKSAELLARANMH